MTEVVLVHGAWHGAWCWDQVVDCLAKRDVPSNAVELPFTGFVDDVATVRAAVESAAPDAIVCGHSYGGLVVDAAVAGTALSRVVYFAAIVNIGTDVLAGLPNPLADAIRGDGEWCWVDPERATALFYGDAEPEVADAACRRLRPMVLDAAALTSAPPRPLAPTTYVVCEEDGAVPPRAQRRIAVYCDKMFQWPTDHSPFLSWPGTVADVLLGAD